jgi:hypothetical protein
MLFAYNYHYILSFPIHATELLWPPTMTATKHAEFRQQTPFHIRLSEHCLRKH